MKDNYLILFLSDYKSGAAQTAYFHENDKEKKHPYYGTQTNEAPVSYLLNYAQRINKPITKILIILSDKASKDYSKFESFIRNYIKEKKLSPVELIKIYYDKIDNEINVSYTTRPIYMYKQIVRNIDKNNTDGFFVDYSGGLRDSLYFLAQLIQYLQFDDLTCYKILYSVYETKELYNLNNIYQLGTMFQAVNMFIATGNPKQLRLFFVNNSEYIQKEVGNDIFTDLISFINALQNFSDTITMCNVQDIDNARNELLRTAAALNLKNAKNLYVSMFKSLFEKIIENFYLVNNTLSYPDIIRWCIDHRLIQQAITFYQSKMPEYYFEKEYFKNLVPDYKDKPISNLSSSQEEQAFYTDLFTKFMPEIQVVKNKKPKDPFKKFMSEQLEYTECEFSSPENLNKYFSSNTVSLKAQNITNYSENIDRLYKFIKQNYPESKNGYKLSQNPTHKNLPKNFNIFLKSLQNGSLYELFMKPETEEQKKESEKKTYQNKIISCCNLLEDSSIKVSQKKQLYEIMCYYVAIKIIRNRMNHASDKDETDDENIAISYLSGKALTSGTQVYKRDSTPLPINLDIENVSRIIIEGLNLPIPS